MKKSLLILSLMFGINTLNFSQSYNNPESMIYDETLKCYFISNKGGNTIFQIDSTGTLSNFVTNGLNEPKGLLIVGDTLISVNSTSIKGYNVADGSLVMNVAIAGSVFMNDATYDGNGFLYISDTQKGLIYRLNLTDETYSTLFSTSSPNGLFYDQRNNAILICNWGSSAKIQSFNLTDSSLITLASTKLANFDGLARDNNGNIYVSSWGSNAIFVFDSLFSQPPTKISTGHSGPADISIREEAQILAVPNYNSNSIQFIALGMEPQLKIDYVSPQNNAINLNDTLSIDWEDIAGATGYELEYSTDSTFYTKTIRVQTQNSDALITDLESNTKYFWRVRTLGGEYKSIFSKAWNFQIAVILNTEDNARENDVEIYPIPAIDKIHIQSLSSPLSRTGYRIKDIKGVTLLTGELTNAEIDVSGLKGGLYALQLINGSKCLLTKIIAIE